MTTSNDPDQIRAEIEQTRAALSDDVDALADTANPKNIANRQVDIVKGSVKDAVLRMAIRARVPPASWTKRSRIARSRSLSSAPPMAMTTPTRAVSALIRPVYSRRIRPLTRYPGARWLARSSCRPPGGPI